MPQGSDGNTAHRILEFFALVGTAGSAYAVIAHVFGLADDPIQILTFLSIFGVLNLIHWLIMHFDYEVVCTDFLNQKSLKRHRRSRGERVLAITLCFISMALCLLLILYNRTTLLDSCEVVVLPRDETRWSIGKANDGSFWWCSPESLTPDNVKFIDVVKEDRSFTHRRMELLGGKHEWIEEEVRCPAGTRVITSRYEPLEYMNYFVREVAPKQYAPKSYTDLIQYSEQISFTLLARHRVDFVEIRSLLIEVTAYENLPKIHGGFDVAGAAVQNPHLYYCELAPPDGERSSWYMATFLAGADELPYADVYVDSDKPSGFRLLLYTKTPGIFHCNVFAECRSRFGSVQRIPIQEGIEIYFTASPIFAPELYDAHITPETGFSWRPGAQTASAPAASAPAASAPAAPEPAAPAPAPAAPEPETQTQAPASEPALPAPEPETST